MVFITVPLLILAWILAILLMANSCIILFNIFDFPANAMRHLVSFLAAISVVASLIFIIAGIVRRSDILKKR
jgi:hypothetical protein